MNSIVLISAAFLFPFTAAFEQVLEAVHKLVFCWLVVVF